MNDTTHADGAIPTPERQRDLLAIGDLTVAYGYAVDDRDWERWRTLFTPDATLDYTHSGGIAGSIAEVAAWIPDALSVFTWGLHSVFNHEIRFTGPDTATGRLHLFNRNGVDSGGTLEFVDVGGVYHDSYRRVGDAWRFTTRREESHYITGGDFAAVVRQLAASTAPDQVPPMG